MRKINFALKNKDLIKFVFCFLVVFPLSLGFRALNFNFRDFVANSFHKMSVFYQPNTKCVFCNPLSLLMFQ